MTSIHRRWDGLAVLFAGAAICLAACSGASPPQVASLNKNPGRGSANTTTTAPAGSPTQSLDEWAACMRGHGDPGQIDPTVNASKVIQITLGWAGGLSGANGACGSYLSAAQRALGGNTSSGSSDDATALKFAQCMRANGVPDYPDPTGSNNQTIHASSGSDLNPASPTYQAAATLCTNQTGYESKLANGPPQPGSINIVGGLGGKS
jgi:hypothetical protein